MILGPVTSSGGVFNLFDATGDSARDFGAEVARLAARGVRQGSIVGCCGSRQSILGFGTASWSSEVEGGRNERERKSASNRLASVFRLGSQGS